MSGARRLGIRWNDQESDLVESRLILSIYPSPSPSCSSPADFETTKLQMLEPRTPNGNHSGLGHGAVHLCDAGLSRKDYKLHVVSAGAATCNACADSIPIPIPQELD